MLIGMQLLLNSGVYLTCQRSPREHINTKGCEGLGPTTFFNSDEGTSDEVRVCHFVTRHPVTKIKLPVLSIELA